jgi:hypothetical protein
MTDMALIIFLIGTYLFGAIGAIVFIPNWRLYMKTADKKISILANISFLRSKENYFDKVLPLILEIRSKNADIVVRPLTSFKG